MPLVPMQLKPMNTSVDQAALDAECELHMDLYLDKLLSINKRPGLRVFSTLGSNSPVDGVFYWNANDVLIAVSNGVVYSVDSEGSVTELTGATMEVGARVTFAQHGTSLFMANGGRIVATSGGFTSEVTGSGVPENVTHVAFMDTYLIANDTSTGYFHFSNVGDAYTWNPLNFGLPEVRPDGLNALFTTAWGEMYLFAPESLEVYYNDGTSPFAPIAGAQSLRGTLAPQSIALAGNTFFYLDQSRKVVRLQGRKAEHVSSSIDTELQGFGTITDAIGDYIEVVGKNFYVLSFPTEKETFVFDTDLQNWVKWSYWDTFTSNHEDWMARGYTYASKWGKPIVGGRKDAGVLYTIDKDIYQDNGDAIRTLIRTGHISHGTPRRKVSSEIFLRMRRGAGMTGGTPAVTMKYRNENNQFWSVERTLSLGDAGERDFFLNIRRNGIYRSRQYEFVHSDNSPFILIGASENVEEMAF